jgi:hypothetical protein
MARPRPEHAGFELEVKEAEQSFAWSTKKVNDLIVAMEDGYKPKMNPFHGGNLNLRKGNIVFEYTQRELMEIKRCATDIVYFANNYCTVMTDEGLQTITLRGYQEEMLKQFQAERFSVVLASRQIGKTICSSIFIAWYVLFNFDRNALVLSNKGATTTEILDKGKVILENLPFFMKPGILKYDVFNSKFDNGCRIIGQTTTKKAAIGFTIHLLFMDEFAHIPHQYIESFYENVYPTVSASKKSKVIITSTPWGFNKFYEIYTAAEKGQSEYKPFRVDWWDVPGRDEQWMLNEVQNLGGEEAFNRQYGNQFIASSSLLLDPGSLKKLQKRKLKYVHLEMPELADESLDYKDLLWHPDFDIEEVKEQHNYWLFSVDIAEGNGGDYSVINIFQVAPMAIEDFDKVVSPGSMMDFFGLKQVGRFKSNQHPIEDFAKVLYILGFEVFYSENMKMLIEWNTFGSELMKRMETVFPQRNEFDEECIAKFKHRIDARSLSYGLKIKSDNKPILCQNFKKAIIQNRIMITDTDTVEESTTFGKLLNGSYAGQSGNDDMIMSSINASEFLNTVDFTEYVEELFDLVDLNVQTRIEDILERDLKGGDLNYDIYDLV